MKRGDIVSSDLGWLGKVDKVGQNVQLVWQDGPLKGREARVPKELLTLKAKALK